MINLQLHSMIRHKSGIFAVVLNKDRFDNLKNTRLFPGSFYCGKQFMVDRSPPVRVKHRFQMALRNQKGVASQYRPVELVQHVAPRSKLRPNSILAIGQIPAIDVPVAAVPLNPSQKITKR
jgi:hypothetical protein